MQPHSYRPIHLLFMCQCVWKRYSYSLWVFASYSFFFPSFFFSPPILLSFFLIQNHSSSLVVFYSLKSECIPFVSLQVYIFVALFLSIAKGLRFPFVCSRSIVWFARLALCNGIWMACLANANLNEQCIWAEDLFIYELWTYFHRCTVLLWHTIERRITFIDLYGFLWN